MAQGNLRAVTACDQHFAKLLRIGTEIAGITHPNRKTLAALDGGGQVLSADRSFDNILDISDVQAVTIRSRAVNGHFEVGRTRSALGIDIGRAGNLTDYVLNLI